MKRFRLTQSAERDVDQIKSFLIQRADPKIARRVIKDLRSALNFLGTEPGAGHVREDPETKPVQIMRVLHGMRDVEEILN